MITNCVFEKWKSVLVFLYFLKFMWLLANTIWNVTLALWFQLNNFGVLRNGFSPVNISVLRTVNICLLLIVNSKTLNLKNIFLFTSTRRHKISEIIGVTSFFNCKNHSKNGCFFFQAMPCGFLKWPKMVFYTFLLNTRKSPKEEILESLKSLILGLAQHSRNFSWLALQTKSYAPIKALCCHK